MEKPFDDRLAELEAQILKYYLAKGFKLSKDQKEGDTAWFFEVDITSKHKRKILTVSFWIWSDADYTSGWEIANETEFIATTTKEMFDKAFKYFTHPYQMPCPYGLDNAEEHY